MKIIVKCYFILLWRAFILLWNEIYFLILAFLVFIFEGNARKYKNDKKVIKL